MSYIRSLNVLSKSVANTSYSKIASKRLIHVSRIKFNPVNLSIRFLPLPSAGTTHHKNASLKKKNDSSSSKKFRYIGYSDFKPCVKAINTEDAKEFDERLFKAAELYDGWFSRNVENLDLAPSLSRTTR